jgi:hypothetical protein
MTETHARWLWYERPWFVIAALVVFWPIGLALMWVQHKFSPTVRAAVSVGAPVLSAAVLAAALLLSAHAAPAKPVSPVAETTMSVSATGTAATSSVAPSSTTATGSAKVAVKPGVKKPASKTTPGKTSPTPVKPPPVAPVTPAPTGGARFTLSGTVRASSTGTSRVSIVLRAASVKGATKYQWWITTVSSSFSYTGQSVTTAYYGLPPTNVLLVVYGAKGTPESASADVAPPTSDGKVSATGS